MALSCNLLAHASGCMPSIESSITALHLHPHSRLIHTDERQWSWEFAVALTWSWQTENRMERRGRMQGCIW